MATTGGKKNFDFRMSKKVAELTQVVHMLFTRNHEKEVEMEALRASYEHEISLVLDDARSRIQDLDRRILDIEEERKAQTDQLEQACLRRETELQARIQELEAQLSEEKTESQNCRDLLIQAQKDLHNVRQVQVDDVSKRRSELDERDREIGKCKTRIAALERELKEKNSLMDSKTELLRTHEKLRKELEQMRGNLQNLEKSKEDVTTRNRNLEADVKALKKELAKRSDARNNSAKTPVPVANGFTAYGEEIENLKKELARYRMELSNRETNFNRVFTGQQSLNTRGSGLPSTRGQGRPPVGPLGMSMGDPMGTNLRLARPGDARSDARRYTSEFHGYSDEQIRELESPRNGVGRSQGVRSGQSSASDHLPQLDRLHSLAKPRMPRELATTSRR